MKMKQYIATLGKTVRATEWWEHKLVPLLSICYGTGYLGRIPLNEAALIFFIVHAGLTIGAVCVSVANCVTDVAADLAVVQKSRMAAFSERSRWMFPIGCLVLDLAFSFFVDPD